MNEKNEAKKTNASQMAYKQIKEKILSSSVSPGFPLREIVLGEELGFTRTPVREAIKKLEAEGLVQVFPNRGAFVSEFSLNEIEDLLDVREALECKAVHLASRRASREEMDRIRESLEKEQAPVSEEKYLELFLGFDFHHEIMKLSKNQFLISAWETLVNRLELARAKAIGSAIRASQAIREHIEILELIQSGESQQAQQKIIDHIQHIKIELKKLMDTLSS
jgi:DNA-binding GntR family transcriptional regulator